MTIKIRTSITLIAVASVIVLSGCSASPSAESSAQELVETYAQAYADADDAMIEDISCADATIMSNWDKVAVTSHEVGEVTALGEDNFEGQITIKTDQYEDWKPVITVDTSGDKPCIVSVEG